MINFFKVTKFCFGKQDVTQFIVFEHKKLFSIIFFYFHKSNNSQDRFHTHAFNAWSVKFFGKYTEYLLLNEKTGEFIKKDRKNILQYFPRNSYHKIGNSTGCLTMLISGKWSGIWKEWIDGKIVYYTWGRKKTNDNISKI